MATPNLLVSPIFASNPRARPTILILAKRPTFFEVTRYGMFLPFFDEWRLGEKGLKVRRRSGTSFSTDLFSGPYEGLQPMQFDSEALWALCQAQFSQPEPALGWDFCSIVLEEHFSGGRPLTPDEDRKYEESPAYVERRAEAGIFLQGIA